MSHTPVEILIRLRSSAEKRVECASQRLSAVEADAAGMIQEAKRELRDAWDHAEAVNSIQLKWDA